MATWIYENGAISPEDKMMGDKLEYGVVDGHLRVVQIDRLGGIHSFDNTSKIEQLYAMVSSPGPVFIGRGTGPYLNNTVYVRDEPVFHDYFEVDRNPKGFFHRSKQVSGRGHYIIECSPMSEQTRLYVAAHQGNRIDPVRLGRMRRKGQYYDAYYGHYGKPGYLDLAGRQPRRDWHEEGFETHLLHTS